MPLLATTAQCRSFHVLTPSQIAQSAYHQSQRRVVIGQLHQVLGIKRPRGLPTVNHRLSKHNLPQESGLIESQLFSIFEASGKHRQVRVTSSSSHRRMLRPVRYVGANSGLDSSFPLFVFPSYVGSASEKSLATATCQRLIESRPTVDFRQYG